MTPGDAHDIAHTLGRQRNGQHLLRCMMNALEGAPGLPWGTLTKAERMKLDRDTLRDAVNRTLYRLNQADLRRRGLIR